jgi:hypothetical protein
MRRLTAISVRRGAPISPFAVGGVMFPREIGRPMATAAKGEGPEGRRKSFLMWISRPEAMIGLCAGVISVVAVFVSAYETTIMRDWPRAAVWPFVQLSRGGRPIRSTMALGS